MVEEEDKKVVKKEKKTKKKKKSKKHQKKAEETVEKAPSTVKTEEYVTGTQVANPLILALYLHCWQFIWNIRSNFLYFAKYALVNEARIKPRTSTAIDC